MYGLNSSSMQFLSKGKTYTVLAKQNINHRAIRTPNLLIRSHTPYPLRHAAILMGLFRCLILAVVNYVLVMVGPGRRKAEPYNQIQFRHLIFTPLPESHVFSLHSFLFT